MRHRRPVENPRHLPDRVAGSITGDIHHGRDELVVPDPPVFGACHRPKLDAAVVHFKGLHQLGAMVEQTMLEIDRSKWGGQLAHIGGGSADQAAQLAIAPVRRRDRLPLAGNDEFETFGIVVCGVEADCRAFDGAGVPSLTAGLDRFVKVTE